MTVRPTAIPPVDPAIVSDIRRASRAANVDFSYMMAQAGQESSFQPDAKATTSSATGLYQFIDTTWLQSVKQWGGKYGLGELAAQITVGSNGQANVADPAVRQQILDLRKNPAVSSSLADELAHQNKTEVEHALGRTASSTDLYLAHFLGAQGATEFVKQIENDGSAKAADLLPQAAAANRAVFYDQSGEAKTVAQIYQNFAAKLERQVSQLASSSGVADSTAVEEVAMQATPSDQALAGAPSLLSTMNILAMAALKLLGRQPPDDDSDRAQADQADRRRTDTSA